MKTLKLIIQNRLLLFCVIFFALGFSIVYAQSTRVDFPTPVTSSEISGRIAARDIGDSRLTSYYYTFDGKQGDIFLKIQANNLNGDIDVFYADNMRPLTKITLYAGSTPTQTGREIYLRKPEKLILRIEGRSPNDDPATFSIGLEGSFQPVAAINSDETENPAVKSEATGAVRVNSVGTILEPLEKPEPKKTVAATDETSEETVTTPKSATTASETEAVKNDGISRKRISISGKSPDREIPPTNRTATSSRARNTAARRPTRPARTTTPPPTRKAAPVKAAPVKTAAELQAEELTKALENVRLVVLFKNGEKIERPMNEVLRFNIDRGNLTIISKNGSVGRYSIIDITKVAIE